VTLPGVAVGLLLASFAMSTVLGAAARAIAPRFGLVDRPGGRKAHRAPTPMGGGVAIWLTVVSILGAGALAIGPGLPWLPAAVARLAGGAWERSGQLALILGLSTIIMAMGLADDRVGLGWKLRLGVQVGLSAILVASGVRLTLFSTFDVPWLSGAITVLWIVGLTNAFNFLDNMDGLAAGVGLIAALLFAMAQVEVEGRFVPAVLLVLVGALGGFLVHNRHPARLFMGDAGSNFLGFLLGALTVVGTFTRPGYSPLGVLAPLLVMAVPLYDTTSVVLIRLREGRSPFEADRRHFSHRLVERGLTPPMAVRTIYLVTLAGGLGALLLPRLDPVGAGVVVAQTICLLGVVALLEVNSNRPERGDVEPRPPSEATSEGRSQAPDDAAGART
jgi:UDP-GlcNAc:undecaprenyl-phosphate/decaprenyl-phosphate GlcNAc-1-phosphate transferase